MAQTDPDPSEEDMIVCRCTGPGNIYGQEHPKGQCPCKTQEDEDDDPCPCCGNTCNCDYCSSTGQLKSDCASTCQCCGGTSCDVANHYCITTGQTWDACTIGGQPCSCCGMQSAGCTSIYCVTNSKTIAECSGESCSCCGGTCAGAYCSLTHKLKTECANAEACNCCGSYSCPTPNECGSCPRDCAGVIGGSAYTDQCGRCVGGTTGRTPCRPDCAGVDGGSAYLDRCGNYVGGTTGRLPCTQDCAGAWGGSAHLDNCGICVGGNTGRVACIICCCGKYNCPHQGQPCVTCLCGDKHCPTPNMEQCECCDKPHCTGCCGACTASATQQIAVVGETITQVVTQPTPTDPKRKCFFCQCGHYRCTESHYLDQCHTCVGGNTGLQACKQPPLVDCPPKSDQNAQHVNEIFAKAAWHGYLNQLQTTRSINERASSLFMDRENGKYSSSGINEGTTGQVKPPTSNGPKDVYVADVHTHPGSDAFNCFSVSDFYHMARMLKDHPLEDNFVISDDGTVYAMHLEDRQKLLDFAKKYPYEDNCDGPKFKKGTDLYNKYMGSRFYYDGNQNYSLNDANAYAMAFVLFGEESGVKLLKMGNDGSFKEIHTSKELITDNNGKPAFKYNVTKCK